MIIKINIKIRPHYFHLTKYLPFMQFGIYSKYYRISYSIDEKKIPISLEDIAVLKNIPTYFVWSVIKSLPDKRCFQNKPFVSVRFLFCSIFCLKETHIISIFFISLFRYVYVECSKHLQGAKIAIGFQYFKGTLYNFRSVTYTM